MPPQIRGGGPEEFIWVYRVWGLGFRVDGPKEFSWVLKVWGLSFKGWGCQNYGPFLNPY